MNFMNVWHVGSNEDGSKKKIEILNFCFTAFWEPEGIFPPQKYPKII